jgi:hypothetical protein
MNADRWREVSRIYGAVLARRHADRPAALVSLCPNDAELRREVESLLATIGVQTQPNLTFGRAASLVAPRNQERLSTDTRDYDVLPDGRVLSIVSMLDQVGGSRFGTEYRVVLNWLEELRQRVPTP